MDADIEAYKEKVAALKTEHKTLQLTYQQFKSMPTTAELERSFSALTNDMTSVHARLATLRQGDFQPVSEAEKAQVNKAMKEMQKQHKTRHKNFKDFWNTIRDMLPDTDDRELWVRSSA